MPRNGLASQLSLLSSETPTASESSQSDGLECQSTAMSGSSVRRLFPTPGVMDASRSGKSLRTDNNLAEGGRHGVSLNHLMHHDPSASSPVGSLANLIPLQESVKRLLTIVTSGPRLPVSFARFDRDGSSGRMFAVSSTPNLDGSLVEFSGTWPTWGIALDGACGELPTLERSTSGSESSSWPTPAAMVANLNEAIQSVAARRERIKAQKKNGNGFGLQLTTAVKMWPTPGANEDAAGTPNGKMQRMLGNHPDVRSTGSGSLNPLWVEWLMGFPPEWTVLEPSETPSSRSKPTRSSKPSRTSKG